MRKIPLLLLTTGFIASISLCPARADDWHGHGGEWYGHGDIGQFHDHDFDHWRSGHWFHGFHDGRDGWWWDVDGLWYYYSAPVYPYPDPYTPPTVVIETPAAPAATVVTTPTYYYCHNPAGYYPYIPQCYGPWQKVVSASTVVPSQPAPTVGVPVTDPSTTDIHQLNAFMAELQNVDLHDPDARAHLKDLGKRVEAFRQSLFHRNYNAMGLLKRTEDLQHRISEQKTKAAHTTKIVPPVAMPAPPNVSSPAPPQ